MCDGERMSPAADAAPSARRIQAAPPLHLDPAPPRLAEMIALVVGAGHGIGAATAHRLAAEGAQVIAADLDSEAARALVADLPDPEARGHEALGLDATDTAGVDVALVGIGERHGRLDVLVHAAGGNVDHPPFEGVGDDLWLRMLDLNLMGPVRTARAAIGLLRRSERGVIVTISSVNARRAIGGEPYSAAKAALESLTGNLAQQLAVEGIRVNAVAPGPVRTRFWDGEDGREHMARLAPWYPLGRVGEPADIAFLASRDAAWITGQVLTVDGGLSLRGLGPPSM